MSADKKDGNNVKSIVAVKQKYIQSLVVFIIADISYKCFLAAMACRSQNLVAWNIPQRVDGGE